MDNVNHPPHYETGKFESIDVMEEVFGKESVKDFCLCNAFKYLYRCKHKHETPLEDVQKAVWYLNYYIKSCVETYTIKDGDDMKIRLKPININGADILKEVVEHTGRTYGYFKDGRPIISVSETGDSTTS